MVKTAKENFDECRLNVVYSHLDDNRLAASCHSDTHWWRHILLLVLRVKLLKSNTLHELFTIQQINQQCYFKSVISLL